MPGLARTEVLNIPMSLLLFDLALAAGITITANRVRKHLCSRQLMPA